MRVEAVVLDMDGLMLDTEPLYKRAWQRASSELGFELDDAFYLTLVGRQTDDCEQKLLSRFGPRFPIEKFRSRWPELWRMEVARSGISTKPGLHDLLSFLERRGLRSAVATSSAAEYTDLSLEEAGLAGRFKVVVTGDEVGRPKPAPDIYMEAARRLDVAPSRCVAFEDSEAGVLSAWGAGMAVLLIPDLVVASSLAVRAAYGVLGSLHEARQAMETLGADEPSLSS